MTANHQEKNARALEEQGAAEVILEADCNAGVVFDRIQKMLSSTQVYEKMRKAQLSMAVPDSAQRLCAIMEALIAKKG